MDSNICERNFLGSRYIGTQVTFTDPFVGTWVVVEKMNEKYIQEHPEDRLSYPSYAFASFVCQNTEDPSQHAIMKIWMQIPSVGSEAELETFLRVHRMSLPATPKLLGVKQGTQNEEGMVPGGFILHLVYTRAPGARLGPAVENMSLFWTLPERTREAIRQSFRQGFISLTRAGVNFSRGTLDHLVWDEETGQVYFINFEYCSFGPEKPWRNRIFGVWYLANPPKSAKWYEDDYNDTDLKAAKWEL
ncbi:hypothetical protein P170DRAFT_469423 [Aspergillus steynii IBT 23096]|uniref:Uncharacterized protein n=1 Tax=Aspergillus steynii IBT 23096 TaxID=1392250 RepID=A0A2I2GM41_9EURO|nr:uncharacterized protein P170DRAFT_469423 [Aspergillus steynii IBT 23096]PLB53944.1 hypothetical protein P170DRAFT_469423 [Aspergillus steynii IBT 23096]